MTKKFSGYMLKGFKEVGGNQMFGDYVNKAGTAFCALGAAQYGKCANADDESKAFTKDLRKFKKEWGMFVVDVNDDEKLPWEHIYGMCRAIGI